MTKRTKRSSGPVAIGYVRLSKEQGERGLGQAAQRKAILAEARHLDLEVVAVHVDDGVSGAAEIDKRPGLLAAMSELRPGDRLLVAKRDRLGRDVLLVGWLEKEAHLRGAEIVSAAGEGNGSDPTSQLMRRIVDAFAEYERAVIRARTRVALRAKWDRGESMTGTIRYGYEDAGGGKIKPDRHEQAVIGQMAQMRSRGLTLRDISVRLARRGTMARNGKPFSPKLIMTILNRLD